MASGYRWHVVFGLLAAALCVAGAAAQDAAALDPFGKIPEFKFCAVKVTRAEARHGQEVARTSSAGRAPARGMPGNGSLAPVRARPPRSRPS